MQIGIFMNYAPGAVLRKEGLGRYIGGLIKGFSQSENHVQIVCPKWLVGPIEELFRDMDLSRDGIDIFTCKMPPIWRIWQLYTSMHSKAKRKPLGLRKWLRDLLQREFTKLARTTSTASFVLWILRCIIAIILLALISIPVLIIAAFWGILQLIKRVWDPVKKGMASIISFDLLLQAMIDQSAVDLVSMINRSIKADVWYVPALFWPEVCSIKAPVVINIPDIETEFLPEEFAMKNTEAQTDRCRKTVNDGHYFITYSNTIKNHVIDTIYYGNGKKAIVIPHMNNNMLPYISIDDAVSKQLNVEHDFTISHARALVRGLTGGCYGYLFYPTQYRPNKNILTLLKAYNYLLHKKFRSEKLVLTGNIYFDESISKYIQDNDLSNEVLICYNVSSKQLAALYACASLAVCPTLYEGGFPFSFGEGMSVGTPSIMSNIPQTREIIDNTNLGDILFDPHDWKTLAEKIEWALDNRSELYKRELVLYNELKIRTADTVAKEYIEAFEVFIDEWNRRDSI